MRCESPRRVGVAALVVLLGVSLAAQAPERSDQRFRAGVDLVTVDVVVVDGRGRPVQGLGRADFSVLEDGRRQDVVEFEAVSVLDRTVDADHDVGARQPARRGPISSNQDGAADAPAGRAFAVVFDDMNLTRAQADQARKALKDFLESGVSPDDTVTLVATSGGAWVNARMPEDRDRLLTILSRIEGKYVADTSAERMTDFEAMRITNFGDQIVEAQVRRRYEFYRVMGNEPRRPQDRTDAPAAREMRGNAGVIAPYIHSRASAVYDASVARNRATLDLLARAVDALRPARGRKGVILLSKGFIYDTELRGFREVSRVAREANVAVYFIDARGLETSSFQFGADAIGPLDERDMGAAYAGIEFEAAGAVSVAEDSGGFAIRNTNDLSAGLRRIADESRAYYLLGYVSPNTRRDGRFRQIRVRVNRPGVTVRARKGYFAEDERRTVQRVGLDPDVQRALDAPREFGEVPVRATALVFDEVRAGAARVMVAAETDIRGFAFERQPDDRLANVVEFAAAATNLDTGEVFRFGQSVEMNLLPGTLESYRYSWYPIAREFQLPTGPYQARVVVRDRNGGRVGSVTHAFDVPPLEGFRLSSPILSDAVQADGAAQTARPVLLARRTFTSDATLFCQFTVYGALRDAATRQPQVSGSWRLERADGTSVRSAEPRPITASPDGHLVRLYGISLGGLPPGDYQLVLEVRDELGLRAAQAREPFTLEPGLGIVPTISGHGP
jgi:VWFA-related protein